MKIRIKYEWESMVGQMKFVAYKIENKKELYLCMRDNVEDLKRGVLRLLQEKKETQTIEEYEI